jgi:hypothetical protein
MNLGWWVEKAAVSEPHCTRAAVSLHPLSGSVLRRQDILSGLGVCVPFFNESAYTRSDRMSDLRQKHARIFSPALPQAIADTLIFRFTARVSRYNY